MERIKVANISKKFGRASIFSGVNFSFQAGQVIGISGNNGVGKTTFIKILSGLIYPDSGQVFINGIEARKNRKQWMENIGTLLEGSRSLYWRLSALQNFVYFSGLKGIFGKTALIQAQKKLEYFDLWDTRNSKVETFSFGMKQRLALACCVCHTPSIILLDEPTSGLDATSSKILENYICLLAKENRTIILASHNQELITKLSSRKLVIEKGAITSVC